MTNIQDLRKKFNIPKNLNPRWWAWQRATGEKEVWEFVLWNGARWKEWDQLQEHKSDHVRLAKEQKEYNIWLLSREDVQHPHKN